MVDAPDYTEKPHDAGDDVPERLREVYVRLLEQGRTHRHTAPRAPSSPMVMAHGDSVSLKSLRIVARQP